MILWMQLLIVNLLKIYGIITYEEQPSSDSE